MIALTSQQVITGTAVAIVVIVILWAVLDFVLFMSDEQDRKYNERMRAEAYRKMEEQYGKQNRG